MTLADKRRDDFGRPAVLFLSGHCSEGQRFQESPCLWGGARATGRSSALLSEVTVLALKLAAALLALQAPAAADSSPSCATDLALLELKMHANYAGYMLELKGDRLRRFAVMKAALQQRAEHAASDACYSVLADFVEWFDDPHLFVFQSARIDSAETARRAATIAKRHVTEASAKAYFARQGAKLDPIEGIWYDRGMRVAILPDSGATARPGRFVAVLLASDTANWMVGSVRATLTRRADGSFDADVAARNYSVAHRHAQIYRHVLLRLSPGIWGKEFPVAPADTGTLDPVDPHRPVVYRRDGTLVFAIPSHDGFKNVIDSMVAAHRAELASADRMVIDLRGNEGGGSGMTEALEPFISLKTERPTAFPLTGAQLLSSPDQIEYARRAFGAETTAFVRSLLARMRARPGELVPLDDPSAAPEKRDPRDWVVASGPKRVGVLIDRGTVSASEVLVIRALESPRAVVFGEPTAGALDYQSTNIVPLSPREKRWYLGYGTITRNARIPAGGMRGKGIPPTVPLDLRRLSDPVGYVIRALARD